MTSFRSLLRTKENKDNLTAYLLLLPVTIVVIWLMGFPIVRSFIRSIHEQNGTFIGVKYFRLFLLEDRFLVNVATTVQYAVFCILLVVPTGLLAAHLITDKTRSVKFLRPLFLIPWVTPYVCSSMLFRSLFMSTGPIVQAYQLLTGKEISFLINPQSAFVVIIAHQFWRQLPFAMLFIAAGLTTIPNALYEAGTIDGANRWQQFVYITLPILKSHIFIITLMVTNGAMQDSESIYTITGGGPGYATETLAVRLFKESFKNFDWNSSSVIGVVLLLIASIFIFLYSRAMKSMEEDIYE